jgi:hypothetical protein
MTKSVDVWAYFLRTCSPGRFGHLISVSKARGATGIRAKHGHVGELLFASGEPAPDLPIWGHDLIEQSLADWWYPAQWHEISADELVVLNLSLASGPRRTETGPIAYLRRALAARVCWAARHLPPLQASKIHMTPLEVIFQAGVVTTLSQREAVLEGQAAEHILFGRASTSIAQEPECKHRLRRNRERWLFELAVLSCLDGMHDKARGPAKAVGTVTIADAFVASIHASLNGAYIYPEFVYAHELLSVGAWLGFLVRGRRALMTTFVAERLLAELSFADERSPEAGDDTQCRALLVFHANQAVGSQQLLRQARRTHETGRSGIVQPKPHAVLPYLWNKQAAIEMANRLDRIGGL